MIGSSEMLIAPSTIFTLNREPSCRLRRSAHTRIKLRVRIKLKTSSAAASRIDTAKKLKNSLPRSGLKGSVSDPSVNTIAARTSTTTPPISTQVRRRGRSSAVFIAHAHSNVRGGKPHFGGKNASQTRLYHPISGCQAMCCAVTTPTVADVPSRPRKSKQSTENTEKNRRARRTRPHRRTLRALRSSLVVGPPGRLSDYPFLRLNSAIKLTSASTASCPTALYKDARMPPTDRCPASPTSFAAPDSLANFFSISSLPPATRNVTFIFDRDAFSIGPV